MKLRKIILGAAMAMSMGMSSMAFAVDFTEDEMLWLGMKIYERAAGRGCGTCHDVRPFPDLSESIKKLSKEEFIKVVKEGRAGTIMTPMAPKIMEIGLVEKTCMSEEQALDALYSYLKALSDGKIKGKVKKPASLKDKMKECKAAG